MFRDIEPALVADRPLLEWLDDALDAWGWRVEPGTFGPGVPPRTMSATGLRRWLLADATTYATRDRAWADLITRAQRTGPDAGSDAGPGIGQDEAQARGYRFLAVGLALPGLRGWRRRIPLVRAGQVAEVHADIVTGFLIRLASIDPAGPNLAGRLIDSAIGYAARRHRYRPGDPLLIPVAPETLAALAGRLPGQHGDADADGDAQTLQDCLARYATRLRTVGARVPDLDVELIALTRLDGVPITAAAARLGIPLQAAYKRRQRAEHRLAAALQHTRGVPPEAVDGGWTAASERPSVQGPRAASGPVA
jgi:hypothetical protein